MSTLQIIAISLIFLYLFGALLLGIVADRKGLNPWPWAVFGGLVWPIGLAMLALRSRRCWRCGASLEEVGGEEGLCSACDLGATAPHAAG